MLSEIIEISKGFQSSVNISYDLHNKDKIQNFIPTASAMELIISEILSTDDVSTQRAKILIGAYGRGKSHIVLVILALLSRNNKREAFKRLFDRLKKYDDDSYKLINNFIKSSKKLLPVVISGNSSSLTQSFLNALQQALNGAGLDNIMPDTHFRAAKQTIEKWEKDYPDTYKLFKKKISSNIKKFISGLDNHGTKEYKEFVTLYPELTAGSVFNPFLVDDAAQLYEDVSIAVESKGYNGLYIVYDEFGKYLETSISSATESDTKFLQDLAEKCNRSGKNQMHLMLICHKDISNYIDMNLPQDKVDGWKGISGRFENMHLHNNYSQMYEIIAEVIGKKAGVWDSFCKKNIDVFDELSKKYSDNMLIGTTVKAVKNAILSCYPLHPTTMYILPRLSEKVAQNERTLFTFLSANHKNTLLEFVEKSTEEFPFVTPDYLYDYFETQFRNELNSSEIHKVYILASRILRKVKRGSLQSKIVKTIALTYIIENFEKFPPTVDNITNTFTGALYEPKQITGALNDLINKDFIVYLKRSNSYLKLKESSGIDVKGQINDRIEKLKLITDTKSLLNEFVNDNCLFPVRYNDEHCITRYFEFKFISSKEYENGIKFDERNASGAVCALFFETIDEFEKFDSNSANVDDERIVTIIPKKFTDISSFVFEYKAIQELKYENSYDEILVDEYDVFLEDIDIIINNFVSGFTHPEMQRVKYYHKNKMIKLFRKAQLSAYLSDICDRIYQYTPIINNEIINKNVITTVAVNSRTKLTTAILENDVVSENLGLSGTGQDVSFMRSTLIRTGILTNIDGVYEFNLAPEDDNMRNVLEVITNFFRDTSINGESSFSLLYDKLILSKYGIGLKRGVIPIYIAVVLNAVKKDIIIRYKNEEVKITSDLLNSINENPSDYFAVMEDWDDDKCEYLQKLESVFAEFIVEREKNYNSFAYIAQAMNRWYMSLPKCAKEMKVYYDSGKSLPRQYIKFADALKLPNNNSREFLILDLPEIFKQSKVTLTTADSIAAAKNVFETGKMLLVCKLVSLTKEIFKCPPNATLTSALREWFEKLKKETIQHQFANNENVILQLISLVTNDETTFICRLAKAVVGLRIEDWNSDNIEIYKTELINFKSTVDMFNSKKHSKTKYKKNNCQFIFTDNDGNEVTRVFERIKYSDRALLLLNDITASIEEMGQSISEQEKRQVLIEILEKMCQ